MNNATARVRRHPRRGLLAAAVIAAVALATLAACGEGGEPAEETRTAPNGQKFNHADVAFASDMIQHHAQALGMVDLSMGRNLDPEVAALAADIRAAQTPEVEQLTDWLQSWDEPVPATARDHVNSHDGGMDMGDLPGMMTGEEMAALEDAGRAQFQDMWLEMMIEHHAGAVEMAQAEQADGVFEPALDLAGDIEASQREEIATMRELLEQP